MIYEYENGVLIEYQICTNMKKLREISNIIIENCSAIKHCLVFISNDSKDINSLITSMNQKGKSLIKNVKKSFEKSDESYDAYTYDEYIFPEIINIIERIIVHGEVSLIKDLFNTSDVSLEEGDIIKYKSSYLLEAIDALTKVFISKGDSDTLVKAKKLLEQTNFCELTLPKGSIKDYYGELQMCFELEILRKIPSERIQELNEIKIKYGADWYDEVISKLNSLRFLEKNIDASVDHQFIKRFGKSGKSKKN